MRRERGSLAGQLGEERVLVADPGQAGNEHRHQPLAGNRLLRPRDRGGQVDHEQHGHDDGKGIEQDGQQRGVSGHLKGHQQQAADRQDARIAKAGSDPGSGEEDQPMRIADVGNRQGAQRRHDRAIGQPQQDAPAADRPLDAG